jgi:hypothetical protein
LAPYIDRFDPISQLPELPDESAPVAEMVQPNGNKAAMLLQERRYLFHPILVSAFQEWTFSTFFIKSIVDIHCHVIADLLAGASQNLVLPVPGEDGRDILPKKFPADEPRQAVDKFRLHYRILQEELLLMVLPGQRLQVFVIFEGVLRSRRNAPGRNIPYVKFDIQFARGVFMDVDMSTAKRLFYKLQVFRGHHLFQGIGARSGIVILDHPGSVYLGLGDDHVGQTQLFPDDRQRFDERFSQGVERTKQPGDFPAIRTGYSP